VVSFSSFESEEYGAMNEEGQAFGALIIGLILMFQVIFAHYMILITMSNNFDLPYLFFFIFGFMWVWVVGALEDVYKEGYYY